MSEVYNPETLLFEQLESLTVQARQFKLKLDVAQHPSDRRIIERQLRDVERQIELLKRRLQS